MRKIIGMAALALGLAGASNAAILAGYDFGTPDSGTLDATIVAIGVSTTTVSGSGGASDFVLQQTIGDNTGKAASGTTFGSTLAGNFSGTANDCNGTSLAAAISGNDYVTFTITANRDFGLNLSGFSVAAAIASLTNNRPAEFFNVLAKVSGDTSAWATTDALFASDQEIKVTQGLSDWDDFFVNLSGNTKFQGISSVEFRIYLWGGSGSTSSSRTDYDQIVVEGTVIEKPAAPSDLTSSVIAADGDGVINDIQLTWTDNSSIEEGFNIYHSTSEGGTYTKLTPAAADAASYTVKDLATGTHWFKVTAFSTTLGIESDYATTSSGATATSSGIDLRAFQTSEGVVVEFVAYDVEADGTIQLALMNAAGEVVWTGSVEVTAGPTAFARFLVPGLELGGSYDFRVRDEVGKWWDADGVTVQPFAAAMTSASLAGITLAFDSMADRDYEIQWVAELGDAWQAVTNVTAAGSHTSLVVDVPDGGAAGFFRVELK